MNEDIEQLKYATQAEYLAAVLWEEVNEQVEDLGYVVVFPDGEVLAVPVKSESQ